jgi:opacity protein-like surface antigen
MKTLLATAALACAVLTPAFADEHADKVAFLQTVDETISGARLAGNPFRFVGEHVDLHCTVMSIPDAGWFNGYCSGGIIVIMHDTTDLDEGQAVRALGTVLEPQEGTNAFGGTIHPALVEAQYLQ